MTDDLLEIVAEAEADAKAEYQRIKIRCVQGLGISELTFNRMVTDLTLHGIQCWVNRREAAKKIQDLGSEAFRAGFNHADKTRDA